MYNPTLFAVSKHHPKQVHDWRKWCFAPTPSSTLYEDTLLLEKRKTLPRVRGKLCSRVGGKGRRRKKTKYHWEKCFFRVDNYGSFCLTCRAFLLKTQSYTSLRSQIKLNQGATVFWITVLPNSSSMQNENFVLGFLIHTHQRTPPASFSSSPDTHIWLWERMQRLASKTDAP